jgi:hypothetical protein
MTVQPNSQIDEAKLKIQQENNSNTIPEPENKEKEPESGENINWKKFREQREKERKEKLAIEEDNRKKAEEVAALKAAMEAVLNKPAASAPINADYSENITEEQNIQNQVKKAVAEALESERREREKERLERERAEFPQRIAAAFPDFQEVCSSENIDYLEYHYPEVAAAFKGLPDSFDKWANIYKAVKRFIPNSKSNKDAAKAEKNFNKPQSMSIPGLTPTGDSAPINLDEKRRQDNWQRMQRIMKGVA